MSTEKSQLDKTNSSIAATNDVGEIITPQQLSMPAVPIQRVTSGKTNTEELQSEKDQHSMNGVESRVLASYSSVPPDDDGSNGQNRGNALQGKFYSPNPLQFKIPKSTLKSFSAPTLQLKTNTIQKQSEEEEPVQAKSTNPNGLPAPVQTQMENALGSDFSNVNIHTNSKSATDVGALAYTQGNDVHFAPGQYNPESSSGQELIGHELTHVVQQREGRVQPTTQAAGLPVNDDKGLEAEADAGGQKAVQLKGATQKKALKTIENKQAILQLKSNANVVQRDQPTQPAAPQARGGTVNFPFEIGLATNNGGVGIRLLSFSDMFSSLSREIREEYTDYSADTTNLDSASRALLATVHRFAERDHESAVDAGEAAILQVLINGYEQTYSQSFAELRNHISRNIQSADGASPMQEMTPELAEAQRVAFETGNTSQLERIQSLVSNIQSYNSQISTWIGRVSSVNARVRSSTRLQTLKSMTSSISDYAERIGQIITVMRTIDTLATGGNGSSTQQSLNRFQAGLDAMDLGMTFFKNVPVIGTLWSQYYYPAATACIRGIGLISQARDRDNRLLTWINSNWTNPNPPSLRGVNHSFMGGQSVFNFMWYLYFGNYQFSQSAENFFMEHRDQLNAICRPRMTIDGEWNPFVDNHIHDFQNWVSDNKNNIWISLYGADLPFPGTGVNAGDSGSSVPE